MHLHLAEIVAKVALHRTARRPIQRAAGRLQHVLHRGCDAEGGHGGSAGVAALALQSFPPALRTLARRTGVAAARAFALQHATGAGARSRCGFGGLELYGVAHSPKLL
jgi:hypothetical protein